MAKRPLDTLEDAATLTATPKKLRFNDAPTPTRPQQDTPSKRGRKPKSSADGISSAQTTPRGMITSQKGAFATPTKQPKAQEDGETITVNTNADRSARRKTNRALIRRTLEGRDSDDEEGDILMHQILGESDASADSEEEEDVEKARATSGLPETPSKRRRGRPKGSKNRRTPTPPPDLPPQERYFFGTRPSQSVAQSSSNAVSSQTLLSHAAYHDFISTYNDPHTPNIAGLHELHSMAYPTWAFELSQNYTVCLYGYGSKRRLLASFADYLHERSPPKTLKTVIINAHHPSLSMRNILLTLIRALGLSGIPTNPSTLVAAILAHQNTKAASAIPVYLLISSLHARPLVSGLAPSILSALATHPSFRLVLTASDPSFPILWSSTMRDSLNILFHDATTFLSYDDPASAFSELGIGTVDSVAELMGRKGPAAASRERVNWVLKSLPENARGLYRILVSEILAAEAGGIRSGRGDVDSDDETGSGGERQKDGELRGIDSRTLYSLAEGELLCSSEMAFRGLLREFVDHAMVVVKKEGGAVGGGEVLGIDMTKEELEGVLEDLVM